MKLIIPFVLLSISLLLNSCTSITDSSNTNREQENYYKINKVRVVKEYWYDYKYGKLDSASKDLFLIRYSDKLGNITKTVFYHKNLKFKNGYGDMYYEIDSNEFINTIKYDTNGNVLEEITKSGKGLIVSKETFKNNLLESNLRYDSIGKVESKSFYTYDSGKLISKKEYDGSGNLIENLVQSFQGELLKSYELYQKGELVERRTLEKGSKKGNLSYLVFDKKDSLIVKFKTIAEANSFVNYIYLDKYNFPKKSYTYKYLKNNLMDSQIWYTNNEPDRLIKCEYSFYK
jgi:hypothetical protein